ncbi:hypothetical protein SLA2020_379130 [Shorea laevis]
MSDGEGTSENLAKVASPDPLDAPVQKFEAGEASTGSPSHYSSCGESELDRYCSANSVLGTPSICSSIATFNDVMVDSEFGCLRSSSFGLGDEFENFTLDGNQKFPSNGRIGLQKDRTEEGRDVHSLAIVRFKNGEVGGCSGLDTELREEDGNSSRHEHSEGEDSMYNYGTDDECRDNSYYPRKGEVVNSTMHENPLLINSSVAFGSNDWDDFEQEVGTSDLVSLALEMPTASGNVKDADDMQGTVNNLALFPISFPTSRDPELVEEVKDIPVASYQEHVADEVVGNMKSSSVAVVHSERYNEPEKDVRDISVTPDQPEDVDDDMKYLDNCSISDVFAMKVEQDPPVEKPPLEVGLNLGVDSSMGRKDLSTEPEEVIGIDECQVLERQELDISRPELGLLANHAHSADSPRGLFEDHQSNSPSLSSEVILSSTVKDIHASTDISEKHTAQVQTENLEPHESYDEIVLDMEEILLDSGDSHGARFSQGNRMFQAQVSPLRDGGSTACTSGADEAYSSIPHTLRIDGVEVVGAKQKNGDVSLSERLVGVKEYTVYKIRVWSGNDQWEVERRYRDFCTLYRRLKSLYNEQGLILPTPWSSVEKESKKIFGNASPDVIAERSVLIQECLRSILHSRSFSSPPSALIWFLSPQDSVPSSPLSNRLLSQSTPFVGGANSQNIPTLGKTIALIVELRPPKSMKQMLEAQHYTCTGCHKHFDDGMTLMRDLVQTFGWGKPRLCEYTGQLFCSSCHTNETTVLPARVLHNWDFTQYPVSQLAKSYLDSIHDQPMLCVSAVNPFLFSKVPALQHVMGIRKRIGAMLPYVRCPFRMSINRGLGSRRYLLESNDFFALRDLIDLSKGAFAALPVMVETVLRKIEEHITEQCLICCDVGVPCTARQSCNDPSSLIFPFQEGETEKCPSCGSVFHKPCFKKITNCPCGAELGSNELVRSSSGLLRGASFGASGAMDLLGKRSGSGLSSGFLSGLFLKSERIKEHKDSDNIILMGSLPSNSM